MRKTIIFILSFLLVLLSAAISRAETRWAVLVGIDRYQSQEISVLKGAANDAKSLAETLKKDLRFPERNVFIFTSDAPEASSPTTGNIVKALKYVAEKARPGDTFFMFFAGHGVVSGGKGYLLTYHSDLGAVQFTALPLAELTQLLDGIRASQRLFLVDACRNDPGVGRGDAPNPLRGDFARGLSVKPIFGDKKYSQVAATLFSCEEGQRAFEWPDRNRGFFTYSLEKGLKGEAADVSGRVTLASLVSYLRREVPEQVQRNLGVDKRQVPWVKMEGDDPGSWVIATLKGERLEELKAKAQEKQKELDRLARLEEADRTAREKERTEIARQEAELKKLDSQIEEMKKRLGTPAAKGGDSLDAMLAMVRQKEAEQKELERLKKQREQEEAKRRDEIERLKAEKRRQSVSGLKGDIAKYREVISSPYGKGMEEAAWKSLVAKYPEVAEGVKPGDTEGLLFKGEYGGIVNSIGMKFVLIPTGRFMMGSPSGEAKRSSHEGPQHEVEITKFFYLGQHEVTQGQWKAVMGSNPSHFKGDDLPVESVSWNDVQEFIRRLNQQENTNRYRLPTEAEWEYACRAGSRSAYSFGDSADRLGEYAWYDGNSGAKTHPVGQKKPNAWGLFDMHGNVWEWCQDWYGADYYSGSPAADPQGPSSGQSRVLRGGSWYVNPIYTRSADRDWSDPGFRSGLIGVRLARTL